MRVTHSSVLLDVFTEDERWLDWSFAGLTDAAGSARTPPSPAAPC